MGDKRRFDKFSKLITESFPAYKNSRIADVAGGKGYLQMALRQNGYSNIITFDKRVKQAKNRKIYRYEYFDVNYKENFDLVVAMHPDEGTDHSICYASKHNIPFVICPCCVKPSAVAFWKNYNFINWVEHLINLGSETHVIEKKYLAMNGRNLVLLGLPKHGTMLM